MIHERSSCRKALAKNFFFLPKFSPLLVIRGGESNKILGGPGGKNIINLPGGQINDPSSGKYFSPPFFPATPSSPFQTLEGLFELTRRPLLGSWTALSSCFRNSRDTRTPSGVRRAKREGPRTLSRTTNANLDSVFVENTFVYVVAKI